MAIMTDHDIETAYDLYADLLYRVALSHTSDSEDAMDAVQDVFVKFAKEQKTFADEEHRKAWLIRVTVNRCHDLHRKRRLRLYTPLEEALDVPADDRTIENSVAQTLSTLPDKYKTVLILHYLEGFSVNELADILKLSVSAVKMRLTRAREQFKVSCEKEDLHV